MNYNKSGTNYNKNGTLNRSITYLGRSITYLGKRTKTYLESSSKNHEFLLK